MFTRYAIYYTPAPGPLAEFGAQWLGWDLAQGVSVAHPVIDDLNVAAITERPRKYGFHGTIKSPFRLARGTDENGLRDSLKTVCAALAPVRIEAMELVALGRFLALVPLGDGAALSDMAAQVVTLLDPFRAPPSDDELARRRTANLTPAQERNLRDWGYPYVLDTFRFHMTLTGKCSKPELAKARDALQPLLEPLLPQPMVIDSLTLVGQRADGMFVALCRCALTGKD